MQDERVRELIEATKEMARTCGLQNWEQISEPRGARVAVSMIQSEYLSLREMRFSSPAEIRKGARPTVERVPDPNSDGKGWFRYYRVSEADALLSALEARIAELEATLRSAQ